MTLVAVHFNFVFSNRDINLKQTLNYPKFQHISTRLKGKYFTKVGASGLSPFNGIPYGPSVLSVKLMEYLTVIKLNLPCTLLVIV